MEFKIDHVTFGASCLNALTDSFASAGLTPDYGGPHSNGISHMSMLAFDDGSYIELISTLRAGDTSPTWGDFIRADGGACAWAVEVADIHATAARLKAQNTSVVGPKHVTRERPDGVLVEWDLAYVGDDGPGALQPFLIQDRTPRGFRVQPSVSVKGSELWGVAMAVIGVKDLRHTARLFMRDYGLDEPQPVSSRALGTELLVFPGESLALTTPRAQGDWLDQRLQRFGNSPCAFIIGTESMRDSCARFDLLADGSWSGRELAWLEAPGLRELHLGVLAR